MTNVTVEPTEDDPGVEIVDAIQRHRYPLETSSAVTPTRVDPGQLLFPVDVAVEVTASRIDLPDVPCVYIRDAAGDMIATTEPPSRRELPLAEYYVEICAPVKVYLRVTASLTVEATVDAKSIDFGEETSVIVGARSKHEHPAGTVTTTEDPEDVMAAISTFGSALKTTSPERSFPTLRGHPPTVELGDELNVPDGVALPETGVEIEVPPNYRHALVVSTLSYYLGATVVPASTPRIVTDRGFTYDLGPDFEEAVERVLKGMFLLDCVTRTEGYYDVPLHERRAVESAVELDFADLYDRPLAERLEAYLEVPYGAIEPHVPEWKLTTHVDATPAAVETLPYLVADLAVVRTDAGRAPTGVGEGAGTPTAAEAVDSFLRDGDFTRGGGRSAAAAGAAPEPTVAPSASGSMEQVWVGDGVPFGASKATADAYRNRLDRSPGAGDVEVTVVCNDPKMADEREGVDEVYGSRDELPFEVTTHENLGVDDLRAVLADETAFFHYIGHIDEHGFECADGYLDATTVAETGVEAFLLNACQSYEQGMALIEAGAIGGIVTLEEVVNSGAVNVGYTLGRLLHNGYPLRPAMEMAREGSYIGNQYLVVGDGSFAFVQGATGSPHLFEIHSTDDEFEVTIRVYSRGSMGSMFNPYLKQVEEYHISSGTVGPFNVTETELRGFLPSEDCPVKIDGDLYWSTDVDYEEL